MQKKIDKPEKIYSIQDVARLNCMPGPVCKKKDPMNTESLKQCGEGMLYLMNDELKKYPACKKDIEPFLEDLKNVYDINILHEEVNWENPDKIQTQKDQYVDVNKNKK